MRAPPAGPRARRQRWTPPAIGVRFIRSSDQTAFTVRQVYRHDQQVMLVNASGDQRAYVFAHDLARDYEQVGSRV